MISTLQCFRCHGDVSTICSSLRQVTPLILIFVIQTHWVNALRLQRCYYDECPEAEVDDAIAVQAVGFALVEPRSARVLRFSREIRPDVKDIAMVPELIDELPNTDEQ